MLIGCDNSSDSILPDTVFSTKEYLESIKNVSMEEGNDSDKVVLNAELPDSLSAKLIGEAGELSKGRFYFENLKDEDRLLYTEIAGILLNRLDDVRVSSNNHEKINEMFFSVMKDYPEIFYVDAMSITKYKQGDVEKCVSLSGKYTMDEDEIASYIPLLNNYVRAFDEYVLGNYASEYVDKNLDEVVVNDGLEDLRAIVKEKVDDYHLIKAAYEYIINFTEYDKTALNNQNIISVIKDHKSVCNGYAKTLQYLMNAHDIECTVVSGTVNESEAHAWNLIKADGEYYYTDATWGDSSYLISNSEKLNDRSLPSISYNYLLITTEEILKTHRFDDMNNLPKCEVMDDNYFVREGTYFSDVDTKKLKKVFADAYEIGDEILTIKMQDHDIYDSMRDYLIKDQKIFDYYKASKSVTYVEDPEHNCMIFWLLI